MIDKKEVGIGKRGLSMIFVIAGIAIVIIAGLVVFFSSEDVQIGRRISSTQVESVREYIEGCVDEKLVETIRNLKLHGGEGVVNVASNTFYYNGIPYSILLESNKRNNGNSRIEVENIIDSRLTAYLIGGGCPLDVFADNFVITDDKSRIDVDVMVSDHQVNVDFVYQIIIERGEIRTEFNEFNVALDDNFGEILEPLVQGIISGYLTDETFNLQSYCSQNGYHCDADNSGNGEKRIDIYNDDEDFESGEVDNVFRFVVVE